MITIGLDHESAHYAHIYIIAMIPALFIQSQVDAYRCLLNSIKKSNIFMRILFVTMLMHFLWCYLFILFLELDVHGIGIATSCTYFTNYIILHFYCNYSKEIGPYLLIPTFKEIF